MSSKLKAEHPLPIDWQQRYRPTARLQSPPLHFCRAFRQDRNGHLPEARLAFPIKSACYNGHILSASVDSGIYIVSTYSPQSSWNVHIAHHALNETKLKIQKLHQWVHVQLRHCLDSLRDFVEILEGIALKQDLQLSSVMDLETLKRSAGRIKQVQESLPVPVLDAIVFAVSAMDESLNYISCIVQDTKGVRRY